MSAYQFLQRLFNQWTRSRAQRVLNGAVAFQHEANTCWMPRPNLYEEHDIGTKNLRYPDGSKRRVRVTKVRDTAGRTFYTFPHDTPLA